jgi:hypothetical protein
VEGPSGEEVLRLLSTRTASAVSPWLLCLLVFASFAGFVSGNVVSGNVGHFQLVSVVRSRHVVAEVVSTLAADPAHVTATEAELLPPEDALLLVIPRAKEQVRDEWTAHPLVPRPRSCRERVAPHFTYVCHVVRVVHVQAGELLPTLDARRLRQVDSDGDGTRRAIEPALTAEGVRGGRERGEEALLVLGFGVPHKGGPVGLPEPLPHAALAPYPRVGLGEQGAPSLRGSLSTDGLHGMGHSGVLDFLLTEPKFLHGLRWLDHLVLLSFLLSRTCQRGDSRRRVTKQHWMLLLLALVAASNASNASYTTRTHDVQHGRQLQAATSSTTVSSTAELEAAIADSSLGRIVLLEGSYLLSSQLQINRDVIIEAEIPGTVVLDGQGSTRVMQISSGTVELIGLNITGGLASSDNGGGIHISGSNTIATIKGCYIYSNEASRVKFCIEDVRNNT